MGGDKVWQRSHATADPRTSAAVAWVGSSGSAAAAASPGAKPHRARQGYAGGLVGAEIDKEYYELLYSNEQ